MKRRGVLTFNICFADNRLELMQSIDTKKPLIFFPRRRKAEFQSSMNLVKGKLLELS